MDSRLRAQFLSDKPVIILLEYGDEHVRGILKRRVISNFRRQDLTLQFIDSAGRNAEVAAVVELCPGQGGNYQSWRSNPQLIQAAQVPYMTVCSSACSDECDSTSVAGTPVAGMTAAQFARSYNTLRARFHEARVDDDQLMQQFQLLLNRVARERQVLAEASD